MREEMERTRDEEEHRLWAASRKYMSGDMSVEELEKIEHPHAHNFKKAVLTLARKPRKRREVIRESSSDEKERYLWTVSRLYMNGDISVEQLEEIERPHTESFRRAITTLAKRHVRWRLFDFLGIRRQRHLRILDLY
jgi:DUF438 domain-containing protein